jgi:hypothetical protein
MTKQHYDLKLLTKITRYQIYGIIIGITTTYVNSWCGRASWLAVTAGNGRRLKGD